MNISLTGRHALPSEGSSNSSERLSGSLSRDSLVAAVSWVLAGWAAFVFLSSLPFKFSNHPTTQHIFTTIGAWIGETFSAPLGQSFSEYGAKGVGSIELISAVLLLLPIGIWLFGTAVKRKVGPARSTLHAVGGLLTAALMGGAVFFHLLTPLGVQVVVDDVSDGGSLFRTAVTVLISGLLLFTLNVNKLRVR